MYNRILGKGRLIVAVVIVLVAAVVISAFFILRENSLRLLYKEYGFETELAVRELHHDIIDGKETLFLETTLEPDSKLLDPEGDWAISLYNIVRCEKNQWGFWELVDHHSERMLTHCEYSWTEQAGEAAMSTYQESVEPAVLYEFHHLYCGRGFITEMEPNEQIQFLAGQVPENVSTSVTSLDKGGYLIHVSYVAEELIEFDVMGIMEKNGMIIHDNWPEKQELDAALFVEDAKSLSSEEYNALLVRLFDTWQDPMLTAENKKIIEKEMMRVGVEFLTDEEVRDRFPGAYMWMKSAELNQYGPAHWLGMSLMIAIPLIVIAIPFVIEPLAAKHRRKKEARQAENAQDI